MENEKKSEKKQEKNDNTNFMSEILGIAKDMAKNVQVGKMDLSSSLLGSDNTNFGKLIENQQDMIETIKESYEDEIKELTKMLGENENQVKKMLNKIAQMEAIKETKEEEELKENDKKKS